MLQNKYQNNASRLKVNAYLSILFFQIPDDKHSSKDLLKTDTNK